MARQQIAVDGTKWDEMRRQWEQQQRQTDENDYGNFIVQV
jgi:hypothetical protein